VDCAAISIAYDDARAGIDFLERAFRFTRRFVVRGPTESVRRSELSRRTAVVMVSPSPRGASALAHTVCTRVEDPDSYFARAPAASATIVRSIHSEEYGSRGYWARDPEGHS